MKIAKPRAFKDRLKGHKQSVISLYSPYGEDGHMLYSVSRDGSMRGWDLAKREITLKLLLDKTVRTKEQKEEQQREMDAKQDKVNPNDKSSIIREQIISSVFSEKFLFGSYEDGSINQWSFANQGEIVRYYVGHQKRVSALQLLESKKMLVSCSHDATIRTWNIETGQPISVYKTSGPVNSIRVNAETNIIQAVVNRNIFYEINPNGNSILKCIKFQKHSITSFFYRDELLLFGNIQNKVLLYDLKDFNPENADVPML